MHVKRSAGTATALCMNAGKCSTRPTILRQMPSAVRALTSARVDSASIPHGLPKLPPEVTASVRCAVFAAVPHTCSTHALMLGDILLQTQAFVWQHCIMHESKCEHRPHMCAGHHTSSPSKTNLSSCTVQRHRQLMYQPAHVLQE